MGNIEIETSSNQAVTDSVVAPICELNDLQLAFIGGGIGDTVAI